MLVAHDLETGLAMRPTWGALYGPQAVSEQGLVEAAIDRLPQGSIVVGDANQKSGLPPHRYSFTRVRLVIATFAPLIAAAHTPREAQKLVAHMMYYVGQASLLQRKRKRPSYPRRKE